MNYDLTLTLDLLEQAPDALRFRVTFHNHSEVKLVFPYAKIHGLRFANEATKRPSEWYSRLLLNASWNGIVLQPADARAIEFRVRPCSVECPGKYDGTDYYRWCVDLPGGEYLGWYWFKVDKDYFCGDSHFRYDDLLRRANAEHASVWTGEATSNPIRLQCA